MNAKKVASALLTEIKPANILGLQHCATRLRFRLKNTESINIESIKAIEGVLNVVISGGQFQVIIGPGVMDVYQHLNDTLHISDAAPRLNKGQSGTKIQDVIFNYISGSLQPLLAIIASAGIIKGLLALLDVLNWINSQSGTYQVFEAIGDGVFYFLPILLGFSAAKTLGSNAFLGAAIGASMMHPAINQMAANLATDWRFLGLPFIPMNYANSVLPILGGIAILAPLERFLQKTMPKNLAIIFVSLISLLVMVPLMLMLFGPALHYLALGITSFIEFFLNRVPPVGGALIGGTWFLLVTMGLHWGLIPIALIQVAQDGTSSLLGLFWTSTMAQVGVAIALAIKNKNTEFRAFVQPAIGVAFLAGITEPIIYGVILKYKQIIPIVILSGAIGGALTAMFNIKAIMAGLGGVLSWSGFIGVNDSKIFATFILLQLGTLLLAMLLTLIYNTKKADSINH